MPEAPVKRIYLTHANSPIHTSIYLHGFHVCTLIIVFLNRAENMFKVSLCCSSSDGMVKVSVSGIGYS